ncbi:MAG TPA: response regulator, partial [Gemmatimonadaceae bacterium]|nr:response regulator [Gemmatimonadaceae bacterium]
VLPERADHLPHGTETVLVVEDEPAVRALTVRTLKALGYTVHAAEDPASALELARDARVQVVLTDIVMPQMSGPDLVARLVQRRPAPAVVYMTGYADDALQAFAMDSAATLLRKPFTPSVLARAIRDALDAPRTPHGTTA